MRIIAVIVLCIIVHFTANYINCKTLKDFETSITKVDVSLMYTEHTNSICDSCITLNDHNVLRRQIILKRSCYEWHEKYNPNRNYTTNPSICQDLVNQKYRACAMFSRQCNKTICHYGYINNNSTTILNTYDTYDDGVCPSYDSISQYKRYNKVFIIFDGERLSERGYQDRLTILKNKCTNYWHHW